MRQIYALCSFAIFEVFAGCGGHGNGDMPDAACTDNDGDGQTTCAGDCDDNDPATYTGATEVCGDGKDNTCDGNVDETCNGLGTFVSASNGVDTNPGTQALPVATIAQGMANAATIGGGRDVYVAQGHYTEKVTMVEGTDLLGGYECAAVPCTWAHDPTMYDTAILDTDFEGVLVPDSLTRATRLDGFRIMGFDGAPAAVPGNTAVTVIGAATISNNRIFGPANSSSSPTQQSLSSGIAVLAPTSSPAGALIAGNDITVGTSTFGAAGIAFTRTPTGTGTSNAEVLLNTIHGGTARTTVGISAQTSGSMTVVSKNVITSGTSNVVGGSAWGIQGFSTLTIDSNRINVPPAVPGTCAAADVCGGIESQSATFTITNNIIYGTAGDRSAAVRLREVEVAAGSVIVNSNFLDGAGTPLSGGVQQSQSAAVWLEYTGCGACGVNAVMGKIRNNILLGGNANRRYGVFEADATSNRTNKPEALENNLFWFAPATPARTDVLWRQWNGTAGTDLTMLTQVNTATQPTATANLNADPTVDATWHLIAGSPCIDAGTATEDPTTDMDGNARTSGLPDIGPDEM